MKIAICDDQPIIVKQVTGIIREYEKETGVVYEISGFSTLDELREQIEEGISYDLLLLDIEVGEENSIETAEMIMKKSPLTIIVFMTAYDSYMMDAFNARPLGYISKPVEAYQVQKYVKKAYEMMDVQDYFSYMKGKNEHKILLSEIYYLESNGRKIKIYSKNTVDEFYGKMNDIEAELLKKSTNFVRINQSFIINIRYFISKAKNSVDIQAGEERVTLPISRGYEKAVSQWYMDYELGR